MHIQGTYPITDIFLDLGSCDLHSLQLCALFSLKAGDVECIELVGLLDDLAGQGQVANVFLGQGGQIELSLQ